MRDGWNCTGVRCGGKLARSAQACTDLERLALQIEAASSGSCTDPPGAGALALDRSAGLAGAAPASCFCPWAAGGSGHASDLVESAGTWRHPLPPWRPAHSIAAWLDLRRRTLPSCRRRRGWTSTCGVRSGTDPGPGGSLHPGGVPDRGGLPLGIEARPRAALPAFCPWPAVPEVLATSCELLRPTPKPAAAWFDLPGWRAVLEVLALAWEGGKRRYTPLRGRARA